MLPITVYFRKFVLGSSSGGLKSSERKVIYTAFALCSSHSDLLFYHLVGVLSTGVFCVEVGTLYYTVTVIPNTYSFQQRDVN